MPAITAGVGDVRVVGELRAEHRPDAVLPPALVERDQGHAVGEHRVPGEPARLAEGEAAARGSAGHVAPHPAALGREEVERRVVPALRLEDGPEKERVPADLEPRGDIRDAEGGQRRVGAGEVEPEVDRRGAHGRGVWRAGHRPEQVDIRAPLNQRATSRVRLLPHSRALARRAPHPGAPRAAARAAPRRGQALMGLVDTAVVGRAGAVQLAGAALGNAVVVHRRASSASGP